MIERVSFDRGVHLRGTPLWFDAERHRELCVVTGLHDRLPPVHARAIATNELCELLARMGYGGAVLPTPWERWVGVGGHQLELVDVGARPFGAGALVAMGREHLLIAGRLRQESLDWPRAEHLVVQVPALSHRGGTLAQGRDDLLRFAAQAERDGAHASVVVESLEVGHALIAALQAAGLAPRAAGLLGKLGGRTAARRAGVSVILARGRIPRDARVAFFDTGLGEWRREATRGPAPAATFKTRWYADLDALAAVVTATGARRVSLLGVAPSMRAEVARRLGDAVQVQWFSRPRQLELAAESSTDAN